MSAITNLVYRTGNAEDNTEEAKKQRRRVQNRLNQRARRQRLQESAPGDQNRAKRPYRVDRWRLEEHESTTTAAGDLNKDSNNQERKKKIPEDALAVQSQSMQPATHHGIDIESLYSRQNTTATTKLTVSISADHHLLRIIHINVFRGFQQNKLCLWRFTSHAEYEEPLNGCGIDPDLNGTALITLRARSMTAATATITASAHTKKSNDDYSMLPDTLVPTKTQSGRVHEKWIDVIPFPQMRENLIRWEKHFDHMEFAGDVIGFYTGSNSSSGSGAGSDIDSLRRLPAGIGRGENHHNTPITLEGDDTLDDEVTTYRAGFILWGEPYRAENWELTPGFLRKWMWTVQGCEEELIESTNRWRRVRGEEPIRIRRWRSETGSM